MPNETIVALATPPGKGSLAVIRISGPQAFLASNRLLPPTRPIESIPCNKAVLVWLHNELRERIDQAMVVRYGAPHSYTGEDVVEISCHGGKVVPNLILAQLCASGARLAQPGEFTRRALLNGKMDLVQAEAVAEIIEAESPAYVHGMMSQLQGAFSKKLAETRSRLIHACALLELGLDFSEEDVEFADRAQLLQELEALDRVLADLLAGFSRGQALKEGWRVALIGKPNVGKSSLMNALLRHERVIVSDIPGTTRDTIDERIIISGLLFRLIDTAGIRGQAEQVEKIGIARARRAAREAELILFVSDQSQPAEADDEALAEECLRLCAESSQATIIHASNKADLEKSARAFAFAAGCDCAIATSATTGLGLEKLENAISAAVAPGPARTAELAYFINHRQKLCLEKARAALQAAQASLGQGLSAEFVVLDLKEVTHQLEALVGAVTTEEVLGEIFANFCIGK